jgi:hypothetical protein
VEVHLVATTETPFPADVFSQLIAELSALGSKQVHVVIDAPGVGMGAATVEELGAALGSSLTYLQLTSCDLHSDFWSAVWGHLPGLQVLTLGEHMLGHISLDVFTAFCTSATRPLQLQLGPALLAALGPKEGPGQQGGAGALAQVTLAAV